MFCSSTALLVLASWAMLGCPGVDSESPVSPKHLASTSSNPFGRIGPIGGLNFEDKLASIFQKVANAQTPRDPSTTSTKRPSGLPALAPSTPPRLLRLPTARPPPHDGFDLLAGSITRRPVIFKFPVTSPPMTTPEASTTMLVTRSSVATSTTPMTTQPSTTNTASTSRVYEDAFKHILDSVPSPVPGDSSKKSENDNFSEHDSDFEESYVDYRDAPQAHFDAGEPESIVPESSPQPDIKIVPQLENANASEDTPDPRVISMQLGNVWTAKVYLFGTVFGLLSLVAVVGLLLVKCSWLLPKGYFLTSLAFIFLMASSRSFSLFYDANNVGKFLPTIIGHVVFDIAFPCLLSAFAIVSVGTLRASKANLLNTMLYNPMMVAGFAVIQFLFTVICAVLLGGHYGDTAKVQLAKRTVFIICCFALFLWFLYAYGRHLRTATSAAVHREYDGDVFTLRNSMCKEAMESNPVRLKRSVRALVYGSLSLVFLGVAEIIGLACVFFRVANDGRPAYAHVGPWFGYNVAVRVLEMILSILLLYAILQPVRKSQHSGSSGETAPGLCHLQQQHSIARNNFDVGTAGQHPLKVINGCDVFCMSPCGTGPHPTAGTQNRCHDESKPSFVNSPLRHQSLAGYHTSQTPGYECSSPDHLYEHLSHRATGPTASVTVCSQAGCYPATYNASRSSLSKKRAGPSSCSSTSTTTATMSGESNSNNRTPQGPRSAGYCTVIDATLPGARVCKMPIYEIPYQCCVPDFRTVAHPPHCPCRDLQLTSAMTTGHPGHHHRHHHLMSHPRVAVATTAGRSSPSSDVNGIQTTSRNEIRRSKMRRKQMQGQRQQHNTAERDLNYRCSSSGAIDTTPRACDSSAHLYNVEVDVDSSRGTWNPTDDEDRSVRPFESGEQKRDDQANDGRKDVEHLSYAALIDYDYTKGRFPAFPHPSVFDKSLLQSRVGVEENRYRGQKIVNPAVTKNPRTQSTTWHQASETSSDSDMYGSNELEERNVDGDTDEYDCNEIYWRWNKRARPVTHHAVRNNCAVSSGSDVTPDSAVIIDVELHNRTARDSNDNKCQSVASSDWVVGASMAGAAGSSSPGSSSSSADDDQAESSRSSVVHTWAEFLKASKSSDVFKPGVVTNDENEESSRRFPTALLDRLRGGNGSLNAKYNYRYSPLETDQQLSHTPASDGLLPEVAGIDGCDKAAQSVGSDAFCDSSVTLAHSDSANSFSADQRKNSVIDANCLGSSGACSPATNKQDARYRKGL